MFLFDMENQQIFLDYAYEMVDSENVYTYEIRKKEDAICRIFCTNYHFSILGEKTVEKLRGRGYLSMEEIYQKYGVVEVPIIEQSKKKGLVKTFLKKQH